MTKAIDVPILVVEDEPVQQELTRMALLDSGLCPSIGVAGDGDEAIEYLFGDGGPSRPLPALVLLDLHLPNTDGFEVIRRLRGSASTRHVPIVVLSSTDDPVEIERAYELGANSVVRKPVRFEEYSDLLARLAWYWICANQARGPTAEMEEQ